MIDKNLTTLTITNNWADKAKKNGEYEEKTIKIQGDCFITNYNVYESSGNSKGLVSVTVNNGNANIEYGNGTAKESSQVLNLSQEKYSIFLALANLFDEDGASGNEIILSYEDIKRANQLSPDERKEKRLPEFYKDLINGVIRFISGDKKSEDPKETLLRVDFKMPSETEKIDRNQPETVENVSTLENSGNQNSISLNDNDKNDVKAFLSALGGQETKGVKDPYFCKNKFGYVGKYQMGEQAMAEMGIYFKKADPKTGKVNYNNDWSGFFKKNKYGINSLWDYRKSPEKQEQLQIDYKKRDWQYIKNKNLLQYIGKTINGVKITESGMLAGAHLVGAGGLSKYLKSNGKVDVTDISGTPVSKYIKQFAGYDVSEITKES